MGPEYFTTEQCDLRIFGSRASFPFRSELICFFFFFSRVSSCVLAKQTKSETNDLKCTEQKEIPFVFAKDHIFVAFK